MARLSHRLSNARALVQAGLIRPLAPPTLARSLKALAGWGRTQAAAYAVAALRWPDETAVADEQGEISFAELDGITNALARALSRLGLGEQDRVALLCRNGRAFLQATLACSKLGCDVLFLNTSFAAPQIADVLAAQQPKAIIYDVEFDAQVGEAAARHPLTRVTATPVKPGAAQDPTPGADATLAELAGHPDRSAPTPPQHEGRIIVLTSGTTGPPKGASRARPDSIDPLAEFLRVVPLRARDASLVAAPLFHSLGYSQLEFAGAMGLTLVLARQFDPAETLALIARHRVRVLTAVPVMLKRILDLPASELDRHDCSSLEVVVCSGSALSYELARDFMRRFGPCVYNLYGATELAWATIATPAELLAAPGTVGRPVPGTEVAVVGSDGRPLGPGEVGRLFVRNELLFEGYTDHSRGREVIDGMMSVGDLGHVDSQGRVFVDSREDDMIVSGGENVYPGEVEGLLSAHPGVDEAVVVGIDDEEFGQALAAFVVPQADATLDQDTVRAYVKQNLARFKVPRRVEIVAELPRNAIGKVIKRALLESLGESKGASRRRGATRRAGNG